MFAYVVRGDMLTIILVCVAETLFFVGLAHFTVSRFLEVRLWQKIPGCIVGML